MSHTKTTVVYHSADFDGLFCREIARKFLPDAELIGWDYGDPALEFPKEGTVYVLDLSPDCFWESPLRADFIGRLVWIDHHKSAIEKYDGEGWVHEPAGKDSFGVAYKEFWRKGHETRTTAPSPAIAGYRIDGVSACRLAWQWFRRIDLCASLANQVELPPKDSFVNRTVSEPLAVRLAGEYDIWDKRDPRAELFQHGLRSFDLDESGAWSVFLREGSDVEPYIYMMLNNGKAIQYAKTKENASIIKGSGFTVQFEGMTFLACNAARYNSFLFTAGLTPEHDACLGFNFDGKQWKASLYHAPGKESHDLSVIAKKHGGGGHKGACGFVTSKLPFLQ